MYIYRPNQPKPDGNFNTKKHSFIFESDTKEISLNDLINVFRREEDNVLKTWKAMQAGQLPLPQSPLAVQMPPNAMPNQQNQSSLMSILSNLGMSATAPNPNLGRMLLRMRANLILANIMGMQNTYNPMIPPQQQPPQMTTQSSLLGNHFLHFKI